MAETVTNVKSRGACIWLTGLPCAGKSTIAQVLVHKFVTAQLPVELFDGDAVRLSLSSDLGFSPSDRERHLQRVAYVVKLMVQHGVNAICAFVSPKRNVRDAIRRTVGDPFVEVFVNASIDVCRRRDVKGHYRLAEEGTIQNFTGVSAAYEAPMLCDIALRTDRYTLDECVGYLCEHLKTRQIL